MKRNMAIILSMALSLSMAGCGAATSTSSGTGAGQSEAVSSSEKAEAAPGAETGSESETETGVDLASIAATEADISLLARLQELTDNDVIGQETLNAIIAYIETNNIQLDFDTPDGSAGDMPEDKPDGSTDGDTAGTTADKSGDASQAPDGAFHGHTLLPQAVLDELLDNHIITQDDYDTIARYQHEGNAASEPGSADQSGETPEGKPGDAPDGKPGSAPDGKAGGAPGDKPGDAPEGKSGGSPDGKPGSAPDGKAGGAPGDKPGDDPEGKPGGAPGGMSSTDISYVGATTIAESSDISDETYTSEISDESALIVEGGAEVTLTNPTITKTGDSDGGDSCNFYGLNAGLLVKDGATLTISGGTITTDAKGANGVFSYGGNGAQNGGDGDGTTVNISDTTIKTTGDGAGGIMTTGGGVTYAKDLTIETSGQSSAAIRTDRGGGTVVVDGGSYTTSGLGSPAIYSTADITVSGATLTSNQSEGVCIEGKNSITLTNCDFTVNNTKCNGHATFLDSIMIYQSMSGDADSGTSAYTMTGGSLTSKSGHVFHVTNTNAVITLDDVAITNEDDENVLLSVCDDGWSGAENIAALKASSQTLTGKILVGDDSKLTLELTDGSAFTGSITGQIKNSKGETVSSEVGEVDVTLDSSSTWTLTSDSYITSFDGDTSQIVSNGYKLYVNGKALSLE